MVLTSSVGGLEREYRSVNMQGECRWLYVI